MRDVVSRTFRQRPQLALASAPCAFPSTVGGPHERAQPPHRTSDRTRRISPRRVPRRGHAPGHHCNSPPPVGADRVLASPGHLPESAHQQWSSLRRCWRWHVLFVGSQVVNSPGTSSQRELFWTRTGGLRASVIRTALPACGTDPHRPAVPSSRSCPTQEEAPRCRFNSQV